MNHKDMDVWMKSMDLAEKIYTLSNEFPKEEMYGLKNQIRRASVSIPSNIAEGSAKSSDRHFKIFLENSLGSAYECETQIEIAKRIKYLSNEA